MATTQSTEVSLFLDVNRELKTFNNGFLAFPGPPVFQQEPDIAGTLSFESPDMLAAAARRRLVAGM